MMIHFGLALVGLFAVRVSPVCLMWLIYCWFACVGLLLAMDVLCLLLFVSLLRINSVLYFGCA